MTLVVCLQVWNAAASRRWRWQLQRRIWTGPSGGGPGRKVRYHCQKRSGRHACFRDRPSRRPRPHSQDEPRLSKVLFSNFSTM